MGSKHREFLGREYLCHILPSAALQPVHALIVRATKLPGYLIADLTPASLRSDHFVLKPIRAGELPWADLALTCCNGPQTSAVVRLLP
ncbi:hypothetical protein GCM10010233_17720 [Streptomyces pseudogriseolus]|nr:hypothetical protein GCM10010233_17720 [Streptomyces gancidicus]